MITVTIDPSPADDATDDATPTAPLKARFRGEDLVGLADSPSGGSYVMLKYGHSLYCRESPAVVLKQAIGHGWVAPKE